MIYVASSVLPQILYIIYIYLRMWKKCFSEASQYYIVEYLNSATDTTIQYV